MDIRQSQKKKESKPSYSKFIKKESKPSYSKFIKKAPTLHSCPECKRDVSCNSLPAVLGSNRSFVNKQSLTSHCVYLDAFGMETLHGSTTITLENGQKCKEKSINGMRKKTTHVRGVNTRLTHTRDTSLCPSRWDFLTCYTSERLSPNP